MLHGMLPIALVAGVALAPFCAQAESRLSLNSGSVDLPAGDRMFPEGPGSDAVNNNCLACHSADHVLNQPSLSREAWQEVVNKMITAYKAPVSPDDAKAIVNYLVRTKGKGAS
jgi:cytochrome c5